MTGGLPTIQAYPLPDDGGLPVNKVAWKPESVRSALLIHDMQRYFIDAFERGASPVVPLVENIVRLRARCDELEIPVYYTAQTGGQDRRDRGLQADFWGPGMSRIPDHQEIVAALKPRPCDVVLEKWRYSAFQRSNLETLLRARGIDQLIVCGVYAHIGCMMTVADAFMRDIEAFIVADGVADFSRQWHDMALSYVAGRCGVAATTDQIIRDLRTGSPPPKREQS